MLPFGRVLKVLVPLLAPLTVTDAEPLEMPIEIGA
jgi:hypothetical protein